ncbi:SIALI-17 repeat-containing surface protein [Gemella haemolysans]|uniref:LPXTG-motif cell wall anchor domain protein n=1 Tax=Gemella haemolysans ATCC 10379 TaxID=546270 RepID=C5NVI6_9BACL|nr:SIALI-17 repeat-containing surface protein [Gemella haemolysans]EER68550.1 LPXTG-motif cell wall anchor domain protein [Gemella haemolysans ATCC 10379]KAA8708313.1 LPXTG cell wall anchor domain-containing protein [Gemella haemolysans]UBH82389.1 LPXTG cell wall anchor domain-containing protein [Gemella haemolysans]VEI39373.1 Sialidase A precursor [Gemella haemolysans]
MKINNFTKCTLAVALGFGLNSLTVTQAADNNVETPASNKINKSFIEQFPFAEKFTDKDGITAVRMKSPDVPLVNKEKGYSKEVVRVINYKQGAAGTVINRIYQYVRFYGAPVHEVPKDSPVNDVPEYNGGANPIDPPILEKPEYNGGANPIDPPILEKPELNFEYKLIEPPVFEKPEYNGGVNPIDPPILEKPELKVPNTPEKPKTDTPNNIPKPNPKENNPQNNNKVLPNTGLETNSSLAIIGTLALSIIGLAILKRKNNQ